MNPNYQHFNAQAGLPHEVSTPLAMFVDAVTKGRKTVAQAEQDCITELQGLNCSESYIRDAIAWAKQRAGIR